MKMTNDEFKRSFKVPFHDSLGLAVYNCGLQRCGSDHSWGPAVRDHYLIHYVISGHGVFDDGEKKYTLSAGDGFLVVPSHVISYMADHNDPWCYCWVGFNGTDAQRLIGQTGLSQEEPIFHYGKDDLLKDLLMNIYNATGSRPCDEAKMQAELLRFLATMMEQFGGDITPHKSGYEYVKKSIRFIDYNYSSSISIDDIASNAGISRSHLYRLFMQHISMPPNEYLTRYRINKAATLLEYNNLSVGEAAYSTGFSDQLYFSRVFKKYKGVPPSHYTGNEERHDKNE
jgi:AraC-like DNA-binding protein